MQGDSTTFLFLTINKSSFLYSVNNVQEVSEMLPLRAHPLPLKGHLGVVNVRGEVIPVLKFDKKCEGFEPCNIQNRLIISNLDGSSFAFVCSTVKKVILDEKQLRELELSKVTQVEGKPALLLSTSDLIQQDVA